MDLTDPKFIQAFMKSKEASVKNIPTIFHSLVQTSKSMKESYDPEKNYLESQFQKIIIPTYFQLVKEGNQEKVLSFIDQLSIYELFLLSKHYENLFFDLRTSTIQNISKDHYQNLDQREKRALIKRYIFLEQSKILSEMLEYAIPLTKRLNKFVEDNIYIFADILAREDGNQITNYDLNVYIHPMSRYQNYYYKLFNNDDLPFYKINKDSYLKIIEEFLNLSI